MTNNFDVTSNSSEITEDDDTVNFNISLEQYLLRTLGPKHLALTTVIPLTVIYIFIFVTGVFGNISVCVVIIKNASLHTATNYYLFSLAVSDLTLLTLGLPNDLSVYWQQYPWLLGKGLCKVRALVSEMVSYTSVLTIVAFSMERYLAICHPLHHYAMSGLKRAVKIIGILWIASLVGATPFAVYTTVNYLDYPPGSGQKVLESGFCAMLSTNIPSNWPIYEISSFLFFLLPMIVILILYIRMGIAIRESGADDSMKRLQGLVHKPRHSNSRKSIIRMLAAVVITFFLCWAPFHAQRLLYLYANDFPNFPEINEWMYYIAGIFYYVSSTVNPILYNVMSAKYRFAFKKTLFGFMSQKKFSLSSSSSRTKHFKNLNRAKNYSFVCFQRNKNYNCSSSHRNASEKIRRTIDGYDGCNKKRVNDVHNFSDAEKLKLIKKKPTNDNDLVKTGCDVVVTTTSAVAKKYKT